MSNAEVFSKIYKEDLWQGGSGAGSKLENVKEYVEILQKYIDKPEINTVLDLGCGDWQFSKFLDLSSVSYLGVDVVESVSGEGAATPKPWILRLIALGFCSSVLLPLDFYFLAQDIRLNEGADVHAHSIVQVGVPADGLLGEGLPANEEVVGCFAIEDELQFGL